jgi:nitrate reductase alpha subunit
MEKQYVYIFSISDKPDLIKVGRTSKHPQIRANDLSKNTAATSKFSVEWFIEVPDAELAENIAHFKLKEYHSNKEYFSLKPYDAHLILEKFIIPLFEIKKPVIVYDGKLNALIRLTKESKNASKKLKSVLDSPQSERDVRIKNATQIAIELEKKYNTEARQEKIRIASKEMEKFASKENIIEISDEEARKKLMQERQKKQLELAKKADL